MFDTAAVILSAALLLALVLNLALKPANSAKLSTCCMILALGCGLLFYGVGFAQKTGSLLMTMTRTTLAVVRMFVGVNELPAIEGTTPVSHPVGLVVFWLAHLMAFYSMASAAMFTLGAEALRQLRMLLSLRGDLTLIYGINNSSIAVGKECLAEGSSSVVFISEDATASVISDLNNLGMSVLTGTEAVHSSPRALRKLHIKNRKLTVYAMDEVEDNNLFYALELKDALEKKGIAPERTRLSLPGEEEILTSMLQVSKDNYGFGYVNVYEMGDLAARAMIRVCPPWESLRFDVHGRAREDYECAVVGFGRFGQAVLRRLIMNGQFAGSTFHAAVFSPGFENESGYFFTDSPELLKQYDIRGFSADGRSEEFYRYLSQRLPWLKLIAVCTGSEELDREISDNLMLFLKRHHRENICVVRVGRSGARYQETVGSPIIHRGIDTLDMLSAERADREAILLNSVYDASDRTPWEKWVACDTFSKMSSRASADFAPAFITAAGQSREQVLAGSWDPDPDTRQTLGETEHKRWMAFHFSNGYTAMTREEFDSNARRYLQSVADGIPCSDRIAKNALDRTHACLIPWEDLDELSAREHAITGRDVDYRQTDINNILALPLLLRAETHEVR